MPHEGTLAIYALSIAAVYTEVRAWWQGELEMTRRKWESVVPFVAITNHPGLSCTVLTKKVRSKGQKIWKKGRPLAEASRSS